MRSKLTPQRILRHPDVFVASVKHHSYRVLTRPIHTGVSIVVTYAFVLLLVAFATNPDGVRALSESGVSIGTVVPLLPPVTVLVVLAGATIVGVPVGTVSRGVRRDLSSSRRRRQRRRE
ncbi:hypothetical protein [Natrialba sp. INN-245]|uniref:hypothetical protein n=1 Tax=Natrialba sp. INN-245 TaxID=2690967 RepID=UPI00130FA844|nr:hypothetical protein [Natrialba sp. INN-245]MWV39723.1 hypothetical protein [Natrialba sp. INN-245]